MRQTLAIVLLLLFGTALETRSQADADQHQEAKAWLGRQTELMEAGRFSQAREEALVVLRKYQARGDLRAQAACSTLIAASELAMKRREEGEARFEAALTLLELAGDRFAAAAIARSLGRLRADRGRFQEAERLFRRGLRWIQELREKGRPGSFAWYSVFHSLLELPYEPPNRWVKDPAAVLKILSSAEKALRSSLGETLFWAGQLEEAEGQLMRVLELAGQREDAFVVHSFLYLGLIRQNQSRFGKAKEAYERAFAAMGGDRCGGSDSLESRRSCFLVLERLAELSRAEGKLEEALSWIDRARGAARHWGELALEATALRKRASILRNQGRHREAREALETAGKVSSDTTDPSEEADRLVNLAFGDLATGAFEQAMMRLERASSLLQGVEPQCSTVVPSALLSVGYWSLGARNLAEQAAARAMEAAARTWCPEGKATAQLVQQLIGEELDQTRLGELMAAAESVLEVLVPVSPDRELTVSYAMAIEAILIDKDLERAEQLLNPALLTAIGDQQPGQELRLRLLRGFVSYQRQDLEAADEDWKAALKIARKLEDPTSEALLQAHLGRLHWNMGDREDGLHRIRRSVETIEALATGFEVDPLLVSFFGEQTFPFGLLVEMLVESERPGEAFAAAERARAQALVRLLGRGRLRVLAGAAPELLSEARVLRSRIRELEDQLLNEGSRDRLREDLRVARRNYEEFLVRAHLAARPSNEPSLGRESGSPTSEEQPMEWPPPLGAAEIQRLLPSETVLVSFFVDASRVLAWVVDPQGIELVETRMTRAELVDRVWRFREAIAGEAGRSLASSTSSARGVAAVGASPADVTANWRRERGALGAELYRELFAPIKPYLGHRRLILVPHEALHYLPFAALQDPESGRFLLEDYSLTYAPSATAMRFFGASFPPVAAGLAVVLGDPAVPAQNLSGLRGARVEALAVAELLGVTPLLGSRATEGRFRELSSGASLLHLAAHGVYLADHPLFSYIALTPDDQHDGKLEMAEVFEELDLSEGPLVVLSACQTALGEQTGGDEVVGLVRAFLAAGSRAVMATLWDIDDESSAVLMRDFYRRLLAGEPAAEALREAQLGIFRNRSSAPFFWAAFSLTGGPAKSLLSTKDG